MSSIDFYRNRLTKSWQKNLLNFAKENNIDTIRAYNDGTYIILVSRNGEMPTIHFQHLGPYIRVYRPPINGNSEMVELVSESNLGEQLPSLTKVQ